MNYKKEAKKLAIKINYDVTLCNYDSGEESESGSEVVVTDNRGHITASFNVRDYSSKRWRYAYIFLRGLEAIKEKAK